MSMLWLGASPAWAVSKEMVQLQTQVEQLQQQMTAMQRSFEFYQDYDGATPYFEERLAQIDEWLASVS